MFRARHIQGVDNTPADYISRFQVDKFKELTVSGNGRISHDHSLEPSAGELVTNLRARLESSLPSATRKLYQRVWAVFTEFYTHYFSSACPSLPFICASLALLISYLNARKLGPETVTSYLSGISYVHKIADVHDPTKIFVIQKLLRAISRSKSADIKMPIARSVLHHEMVRSLQRTNSSAFLYNFFVELLAHARRAHIQVFHFSTAPTIPAISCLSSF